jgi:hypothetical protein
VSWCRRLNVWVLERSAESGSEGFGTSLALVAFDINDWTKPCPDRSSGKSNSRGRLVIAGRDNLFSRKDNRRTVLAAVSACRSAMREFADQLLMAV